MQMLYSLDIASGRASTSPSFLKRTLYTPIEVVRALFIRLLELAGVEVIRPYNHLFIGYLLPVFNFPGTGPGDEEHCRHQGCRDVGGVGSQD